ncbi:MAG: DUF2993 domain-containing protein [Chroococcales cyanobacterium]
MDIFALILTSLLAVVSPAGLIADTVVENALRSRFQDVETLEVRIDNTPSYQAVQGKIDRIRIASRGVQLRDDLRIEALEVETDPLDLDLQQLRKGGGGSFREAFRKPLQGAVRLVLTEEDLNQTLQSPAIANRLEQLVNRAIAGFAGSTGQQYQLLNPQLELLEADRFRVKVQLRPARESEGEQPLDLMLEAGLAVLEGQQLQLLNPTVAVNGTPLPPRLTQGIIGQLSDRLNIGRLEDAGIISRILQLDLEENQVELAAFVRVEQLSPESVESNRKLN